MQCNTIQFNSIQTKLNSILQMEGTCTWESDVTGHWNDPSLAPDVPEEAIGGPWKDLAGVAAEELYFVFGRVFSHNLFIANALHW